VLLAAEEEGRSASQVVAAAVRAYVEGRPSGAEELQEAPEAPDPSLDPRQAVAAVRVPQAHRPVLVAVVRPGRRPPAGEVPMALGRPDTCVHPPAARRGRVGVVRHCAACAQVFAPTPFGRVAAVVPAEDL
jgi:hypothetical protein